MKTEMKMLVTLSNHSRQTQLFSQTERDYVIAG